MKRSLLLFFALIAVAAQGCGRMTKSSRERPGAGAVIYEATIITMDAARPSASAVVVKDGKVLDVGDINELVEAYSGAAVEERYARMTILPGFIDVSLEANAPAVGVTGAARAAVADAPPEPSAFAHYEIADAASFGAAYGEAAPDAVRERAAKSREGAARFLPFASFAPLACGGEADGEAAPALLGALEPYWRAGLSLRLRADSAGARARAFAALEALERERAGGRLAIESAGAISPEEAARAGALGAALILSDAPLADDCAPAGADDASGELQGAGAEEGGDAAAPPALPQGRIALAAGEGGRRPLDAAGARLDAGDGARLSPKEALEAITIDAAFALGLDGEIGSIAPGKRADFVILDANPLATAGEAWSAIRVEGVIFRGVERPAR